MGFFPVQFLFYFAEMQVDELESNSSSIPNLPISCNENQTTEILQPRFELTFLNVAFKATFPNPKVSNDNDNNNDNSNENGNDNGNNNDNDNKAGAFS